MSWNSSLLAIWPRLWATPWQDAYKIITTIFKIEVDTIKIEARLLNKKIIKVLKYIRETFSKDIINRYEAELLAGLISFYVRVVRLGRTFT
jgi:hypothetical protein